MAFNGTKTARRAWNARVMIPIGYRFYDLPIIVGSNTIFGAGAVIDNKERCSLQTIQYAPVDITWGSCDSLLYTVCYAYLIIIACVC
ncbi:hypothetical protein K445DRAFT_152610 [Daldinia sp. EC12]|nr:hypothetical protein K445DRAFT_152610 [Daldinia sp. EC12]